MGVLIREQVDPWVLICHLVSFLARRGWDNMDLPDVGIWRKADTTVAINRRLARDTSEIQSHVFERSWPLLGLRRVERREGRSHIPAIRLLEDALLRDLNIKLI
jgi:hypothetical protein